MPPFRTSMRTGSVIVLPDDVGAGRAGQKLASGGGVYSNKPKTGQEQERLAAGGGTLARRSSEGTRLSVGLTCRGIPLSRRGNGRCCWLQGGEGRVNKGRSASFRRRHWRGGHR